ncbi:MAG: type 1 glutamine amidotransferase domain-containing protein, partial [Myxococcota bacterium]
KSMLADSQFSARLQSTKKLEDVNADDYEGVYIPGGYGLLFDLVDSETSQALIRKVYEDNKPVAAVCHGPATLSRVKLSDGSALIADRQVTGFTREEEIAMNTLDKIPFLLEEAMIDSGGVYRKKSKWSVLVVEDGRLITGQNPASAKDVGVALARALAA